MTRQEVSGILGVLESEYPQSFARLDAAHMSAKLNLWADAFCNDDGKLVYAAVMTIIAGERREFAPNIGHIKHKMHELTTPHELSEQEAWALVSKACTNGIYGFRQEFDRLPPEVQAAVGHPEQLKEWAMMDMETVQSVVASNFMRSYRVRVQREKEMSMIPAEIRTLLADVGSKMSLEEHAQEVREALP